MKYDLTILHQLMERPMYGYELKKVIEQTLTTCDTTGAGFSSAMIYPSLAAFEKKGYITKEVQLQEGKPNRNIYSMTGEGRQFFYTFVNTITPKVTHDRELFYYRLTCFEYLTEKSRRKLLLGRRVFLEGGLDSLSARLGTTANPYTENLHGFTTSLIRLELEHIAFFEAHTTDPCLVPPEEQHRIDVVS